MARIRWASCASISPTAYARRRLVWHRRRLHPRRPAEPTVAKPAAPSEPLALPAMSALSLVAIGASTGGTEAIASVLTRMPAGSPAIVVTQHIPAGFSRAFAERLNKICRLEVKEAEDGDEARAGRALVAPGDFHMLVRARAGQYHVMVKGGPRVCYQRPYGGRTVPVRGRSGGQARSRRADDRHGIGASLDYIPGAILAALPRETQSARPDVYASISSQVTTRRS